MSQVSRRIRQTGLVLSLLTLYLACPSVGLTQQDNNLIYHMFIRSFADTSSDTVPPNAGGEIGDLKGIRENLDYLNDGDPLTDNDLEVGILWLMPVFPSQSYHGYDVTNYNDVNPDYGTLQELKDLIRAAHQRGVRIMLDIPVNHTGNEHTWFKQAVEDPSSRFRRFYHFSDCRPTGAPQDPGTSPPVAPARKCDTLASVQPQYAGAELRRTRCSPRGQGHCPVLARPGHRWISVRRGQTYLWRYVRAHS